MTACGHFWSVPAKARPTTAAVLALDLATKTGWAYISAAGVVSSGVQNFEGSRGDGGGMRFLRFKRWLTEMKAGGLDSVYYEEVRGIAIPGRRAGIQAAQVYGGFVAILCSWCEHHGIPYAAVPLSTIKKFGTGRGNCDKDAMVKAARALGCEPLDHNEADAFVLLRYATSELGAATLTLSAAN